MDPKVVSLAAMVEELDIMIAKYSVEVGITGRCKVTHLDPVTGNLTVRIFTAVGGNLVRDLEDEIKNLEKLIAEVNVDYATWKSSQNTDDYKSYVMAYSLAQASKDKCTSITDEIEEIKNKLKSTKEKRKKVYAELKAYMAIDDSGSEISSE